LARFLGPVCTIAMTSPRTLRPKGLKIALLAPILDL
jgi:hypothetical protein